jgi:hypothetical protein
MAESTLARRRQPSPWLSNGSANDARLVRNSRCTSRTRKQAAATRWRHDYHLNELGNEILAYAMYPGSTHAHESESAAIIWLTAHRKIEIFRIVPQRLPR